MRKIIISFCILFAALSLQAQSVNGIRIYGGTLRYLFTWEETKSVCQLIPAL